MKFLELEIDKKMVQVFWEDAKNLIKNPHLEELLLRVHDDVPLRVIFEILSKIISLFFSPDFII